MTIQMRRDFRLVASISTRSNPQELAATASVALPRHVPGIGALTVMELRKLVRRPMWWVLVAIITILAALFFIVGYLVSAHRGTLATASADLFPPGSIPRYFMLPSALGLIVTAILAAGVVGSEYSWGTVRSLIATGVPRGRLLGAKFLATFIGIVVWVLLGFIVGMICSCIVTIADGHALTLGGFGASWLGDFGLMWGRTLLSLTASMAIGFVAAVVGRSMAAGIAAPIVWQVIEVLIGGLYTYLGNFGTILVHLTLNVNDESLAYHNAFGAVAARRGLVSQPHAVAVMFGYIVVLLAISFIVFLRRDVTSGA